MEKRADKQWLLNKLLISKFFYMKIVAVDVESGTIASDTQ